MYCFFVDWVDVANNIFFKCHINPRLERMSECDANVFVALYEAILGEKVPGNLFMLLQPYRNMCLTCV